MLTPLYKNVFIKLQTIISYIIYIYLYIIFYILVVYTLDDKVRLKCSPLDSFDSVAGPYRSMQCENELRLIPKECLCKWC